MVRQPSFAPCDGGAEGLVVDLVALVDRHARARAFFGKEHHRVDGEAGFAPRRHLAIESQPLGRNDLGESAARPMFDPVGHPHADREDAAGAKVDLRLGDIDALGAEPALDSARRCSTL